MLIMDWSSDVCSSDLAGDAARGDVALVVAAAGLALAFGKRLDRATLVQAGAIDQDQAASRRARRIVMLERHDQLTPCVTSIDCPSLSVTIAFFMSERT